MLSAEKSLKAVRKDPGTSFSQVVDQLGAVQDFSIGTSFNEFKRSFNVQGDTEITPVVKNSFCGQIKSFYLIKHELTTVEMESIIRSMKIRSDAVVPEAELAVTKKKKGFFSLKQEEMMDYENFEASALLNINAFPDLNQMDGDTAEWAVLSGKDDKVAHSIISVQHDSSKGKKKFDRPQDRKYEIRAKGVSYLEKNRFEDVLFSIGNIDIILYILEVVNQAEGKKQLNWTSENRSKIFCDVLHIIEILCEGSNNEDILIFLRQNGFYLISRLLQGVLSSS